MPPPTDPFDDPQLKQAMRRLYLNVMAEPALRERAAAAMAAGIASPEPISVRRSMARSGWKMAAAIALAIGGAGSIGYQIFAPRWQAAAAQATADARNAEDARRQQDAMYAWMVGQLSTNPPVDALVTVTAADAGKVSDLVGRKLPAIPAAVGPWMLTGVSVVSFNASRVGRFDYANGDRRVMFVSLPLSAAPSLLYAKQYGVSFDGHSITGYVENDGLNCVIGDRAMTPAEADAFRDAVHAKL